MLTREQVWTMVVLRNREGSVFSCLPDELINQISKIHYKPGCDIDVALRLAASGLEDDLAKLVDMIRANPQLLLQAGNVITRGGVRITRTMLYEFFLGEGDPAAAKRIEFGFAEICNERGECIGEAERIRQYERYRPHIEALARQIESKQPAFDLRPLIDIIKNSSEADIAEALNINAPDRTMTRNTPLRAALAKFRKAVSPKSKTVGMHYEHYTTLQQAFDLLYNEWSELSNNDRNYDKCDLVWRQIIGYLQRGLPTVDRIAFARAFSNDERSLNYKYIAASAFPDCSTAVGSVDLVGLGFDSAILRGAGRVCGRDGVAALLENTCRAKISCLQNLRRDDRSRTIRPGV